MTRAALILSGIALLIGALLIAAAMTGISPHPGARHFHAPSGGMGPPHEKIVDWDSDFPDIEPFSGFDVLPLGDALAQAHSRFRGKLIAARLVPPLPNEYERDVELVYEMRLMTPQRDVLIIRLDARNGNFLEVAGAGLAQARRLPEGRK